MYLYFWSFGSLPALRKYTFSLDTKRTPSSVLFPSWIFSSCSHPMRYSGSWPCIHPQMQPCVRFPVSMRPDQVLVCVCVCVRLCGRASGPVWGRKEPKRGGVEAWEEETSKTRGNRIPTFRQSGLWGSETKETGSTTWPWTPRMPPLSGSIQLFTHSALSATTRHLHQTEIVLFNLK